MFEAATITYLVGSGKSPALLFENIKGHPGHKALYKIGIDFGGGGLKAAECYRFSPHLPNIRYCLRSCA
jgi:hypothetical protein